MKGGLGGEAGRRTQGWWRIDSPALKKAVKHAHNLLMKEVNVVETLGKRLGVCVLLCCIRKGRQG